MPRVLVPGGPGVRGRELVPRLAAADFTVRVLSRRPAPAEARTEWAQAQIETGEGLAEAVDGAAATAQGASSPFGGGGGGGVGDTRRLRAGEKGASVSHFVYISIVGIDRIP